MALFPLLGGQRYPWILEQLIIRRRKTILLTRWVVCVVPPCRDTGRHYPPGWERTVTLIMVGIPCPKKSHLAIGVWKHKSG